MALLNSQDYPRRIPKLDNFTTLADTLSTFRRGSLLCDIQLWLPLGCCWLRQLGEILKAMVVSVKKAMDGSKSRLARVKSSRENLRAKTLCGPFIIAGGYSGLQSGHSSQSRKRHGLQKSWQRIFHLQTISPCHPGPQSGSGRRRSKTENCSVKFADYTFA